jgi:hypothetical protein
MSEQLIALGICVALILVIVICLLAAIVWLIFEFGYRMYCTLTGRRWTRE